MKVKKAARSVGVKEIVVFSKTLQLCDVSCFSHAWTLQSPQIEATMVSRMWTGRKEANGRFSSLGTLCQDL